MGHPDDPQKQFGELPAPLPLQGPQPPSHPPHQAASPALPLDEGGSYETMGPESMDG